MGNIKVAIRIRPVSDREINITGAEIVVHTKAQEISLTNLKISSSKKIDSRERTKRYRFDYCFDSSNVNDDNYASQTMIYDVLGQSVIDAFSSGFNSCLVAYGQSATGKTYTMMGSKDDPGLIPRICNGLFEQVENESGKYLSISYLELYNEKVRDLLEPGTNLKNLRVREHPRLGPYVQGLTHHRIESLETLMSFIEEGSKARKTAPTLQNQTSSRSHALLTLSIEPNINSLSGHIKYNANARSSPQKSDFPRGSRLHLVDLAGSENSTACGGVNRLKEGANINKSLVALGNVISALAERTSKLYTSARKFIPYRDSILTWLLKDSLGGNATTIMLATISPASGSYNETSNTLRFAQRAQSVINKPVIYEDPVSKVIRELQAEISRLKSLLLEKNTDPSIDCKSICTCLQSKSTPSNDQRVTKYTSNIITPKVKLTCELPKRRHSFIENLPSKFQGEISLKQFLSLEFIPICNDSVKCQDDALQDYKGVEISELLDDEIEEAYNDNIKLKTPGENVNLHQNNTVFNDNNSDTRPLDSLCNENSELLNDKININKPSEIFTGRKNTELVKNSESRAISSSSDRLNNHEVLKELQNKKEKDQRLSQQKIKAGSCSSKLNINSLKRKSSKDSSSSSSKDELCPITISNRERRQSLLGSEQKSTKPHTIIQRARRADIVAAVTERLYATKKNPEESNTASTSASDIRSPERSEVKLTSTTRMKLQEISRKMLAKRRKICVDTQTDNLSTTRVKDVSVYVCEPKICYKDVSVLTDYHEDNETLETCNNNIPTLRVKEVSTSTSEFPPPKPITLLKDASIITDDYNTIEDELFRLEKKIDSGIFSDNTSIGVSDFSSEVETIKMVDNSTNCYNFNKPNNRFTQTLRDDIQEVNVDTDQKHSTPCHSLIRDTNYINPCCQAYLHSSTNQNHIQSNICSSQCNNSTQSSLKSAHKHRENNIICISLSDTCSITIESSNTIESKVQVIDSDQVNFTDNESQTERINPSNIENLINQNNKRDTRDSSTNTDSINNHSESKTFRIENIFPNSDDIPPKLSKNEDPIILDSIAIPEYHSDIYSSITDSTLFPSNIADKDQEIYFSDDSLDLKNDNIFSNINNDNGKKDIKNKDDSKPHRTSICPPDVVAHTKQNTVHTPKLPDEPSYLDDFDDNYIELPKVKFNGSSKNIVKPIDEYQSLILGNRPLISIEYTEENDSNLLSVTKDSNRKKVSFGETSTNETVHPILVNYPRYSTISPKSIIKTTYKDEKQLHTTDNSIESNSELYTPQQDFDITQTNSIYQPLELNKKNDDDRIEHINKDTNSCNENVRKRDIFEEYLEEAIVFMRHINSVNLLMNTNKIPDKIVVTKPKYRETLRTKYSSNHITNPINSWDSEITPYEKCFKSIDKLEKCLNKIKRNDALSDEYDIKIIDSSDLDKFSSDSEELKKIKNLTIHDNNKRLMNNSSELRRRSRSKYLANKKINHTLRKPQQLYPKLSENESALIARVRKSLPSPRCSITKYDSSNENLSSNEALSSIEKPSSSHHRLGYLVSPRLKFLQLLRERRQSSMFHV